MRMLQTAHQRQPNAAERDHSLRDDAAMEHDRTLRLRMVAYGRFGTLLVPSLVSFAVPRQVSGTTHVIAAVEERLQTCGSMRGQQQKMCECAEDGGHSGRLSN